MRGQLFRALLLTCVGLCAALLGAGSWAASAQSYNGVAPGSSTVPDGIAAPPGGPALVTWPGFQMLATGGSRVFIQTSVQVKPELKREGSAFVVTLPSVSLPAGNARLPLDTSFFNTPVKSVRARPRKDGGVAVQIDMRPNANVSPTLRSEKAPTGYFFVYVDFPSGNYR